ncbi:MAG TPA: MgtC/SapB family protein [Bacteroidota bacterium]|nr:MgtC/SapB family protein [Bacteroidota bacterium]
MVESTAFFLSVLPSFLVRSGFAILCGSLIGIERERRGKPAGLRTNLLICLGSCLYMLASEFLFQRAGSGTGDPSRIASQVVTGIGFLGAGTIIQSRGTITGLTSAATIWVVAALGIFIGAGFPWIGFCGTLLVLLSLVVFGRIEPKLLGKCHFVQGEVQFLNERGRTRSEMMSILADHEISVSNFEFLPGEKGTSRLMITYCDKHPAHSRFMSELWQVPGILEVSKQKNHTVQPD